MKLFRVCALYLPNSGSCDEKIHCFNPSQPCYSGHELLKSQLSILYEPDENPFTSSLDDEEMDQYLSLSRSRMGSVAFFHLLLTR